MPVYKYFIKFRSAGRKKRSLILAAATFYLFLKCYLFANQLVVPVISSLDGLYDDKKAYCLLFLQILGLIVLACLLVFIVSLATDRPKEQPLKKNSLFRHPLMTFFATTSIVLIVVGFIPTVIAKVFFDFEKAFYDPIWPRSQYFHSIALLAFCVGFFRADIKVSRDRVHWWTAPFFILPFRFFNSFPLLWWSFLSAWLPSRYWTAWRIPLTLATCFLPLLSYPESQPIRDTVPAYKGKGMVELEKYGDNCYQIVRVPGKYEFYMVCTSMIGHFTKGAKDVWTMKDKVDFNVHFNEASYNFTDNKAYVFNYRNSSVHVIDLESMSQIDAIRVPRKMFPTSSVDFHQLYDSASKRLFIADSAGLVLIIDVDRPEIIRSLYIHGPNGLVSFLLDEEKNCLILLFSYSVGILDLEQDSIVRTLTFRHRTGGMDYIPEHGEIFVSFPEIMKIDAFKFDDLEVLRSYHAPFGVRTICADPAHEVLISTSLTGSTEVRNLLSGELIRRNKTVAWAHWIELFPEMGKAVISAGASNTRIWNYLQSSGKLPWKTRMEIDIEKWLNYVFLNVRPFKSIVGEMASKDIRKTSMAGHDTSIFMVGPSGVERSDGQAILQLAGYNVSVMNYEEFLKREPFGNSGDVFIVDIDGPDSLPEKIIRSIEKNNTDARIVNATRDPNRCTGSGYDCFTIPYNDPIENYEDVISLN